MKKYLITGGAGFIGCNFVRYLLKTKTDIFIVILDKLTYAGKVENIKDCMEDNRVQFIQGDICDQELVGNILREFQADCIVNFAAESHVDRSIANPKIFLETNILGIQNLLEMAKQAWMIGKDKKGYPIYQENKKFLQISTDEVYGSLEMDSSTLFTEDAKLNPSSPYSASKASADLIVMAYKETYHLPVNITRCSNNYGPYQFPEKLIPLMIGNVLEGKKLPVYGDGKNVRDWLYVEDHCKAIDLVLEEGKVGEIYNIGSSYVESNIEVVKDILKILSNILNKNLEYEDSIQYVSDRLGHDTRYGVDSNKIRKDLGWAPETAFMIGLEQTIRWYLRNTEIFE